MDEIPESEVQTRQLAQAIQSQAASWMNRGIALLGEGSPASLKQALQCIDRSLELLRHLPFEPGNQVVCYNLAAGWVNRSDTLAQLGGAENLVEALNGYGQAIALLRRLPLEKNPLYRRTLAAAWLNRGMALEMQGTARSVAEAVRSYARSAAVQRNATSDARDRRMLGRALVNQGGALLVSAGPSAATEARALAREALQLIGMEKKDPATAESGFKARHILCQAINHLLSAETTPSATAREELISEATDVVDEGMQQARHWEQQGVESFRPLVHDLFRFGSHLYQMHQPHFLGEFLLESLDPAHAPGAIADSQEMHAAAITALRGAFVNIQRNGFQAVNTPQHQRVLETLQELRVTEARLAELRQKHLQS